MTDPSTGPGDGVLTGTQINEALAGLPDWRHRRGALVTAYAFESSAAAIGFIAAVGAIAEERNHHPDLDWRYDTVFLAVSSHEAGSQVTGQDTGFAEAVSQAATRDGGSAEPQRHPAVHEGNDGENP
ncbi:MAG: 4a-hydroxytetrahydrobiopterin dehydratase [Arthrobacter sp.]|uniref:4a-hydroxytetrahydrobiopterin dehydratase n=1 Tax=unclassified Arthrobacter TaxID=235627 RepID=UPI00264CC49C|nr:4a-hydroxytetrahydrobiopterin dehydratase [Micrococcaceae bacterium]MDN5812623.1 4a-hydroxytetrahydrobiopterin dehydratase [Micrococcaceae bacterium]MDN5824266.1 4a-hydroxytetrahydrobiopterin dehydratase [Micrococcaceae bacterium]MDN5880421.1 4a-hydroxytetrahydrobiopterin dehydratase [Micrococcaceae bacterium]MDN5887208.1 4a-hydroxytetrahydrobiopterin dehydratase [Micrococcaceae bacterium]